ncbi:hypothetical protein F5Y01DRAFT_322769 [Xylaria sp. FL0043]|nr:hypothetical protein F5Y01DRAFT_322769 [Xylaria sp. FL0043]
MAGLTPQDYYYNLARMVVEFSGMPGSCVIDMPTTCQGLDIASAIEIVVKQKEVSADSMCAAPTGALSPPTSLNNQQWPAPPGNGGQTPPSLWTTTSWPIDPGATKPSNDLPVPVKEDPVVPRPAVVHPSDLPSEQTVTSAMPAKDTPTPAPVPVKEEPAVPSSESCSTSHISSFTTITTTVLNSVLVTPLPSSSSPSISSSPSPSTSTSVPNKPTLSIITKVITTSPLPPSRPSHHHDPPPPPATRTSTVTVPQRPHEPTRPANPPAPTPTPADPICNATYTRVDVSSLTGLDPHFFEKYLGLLGLGHLVDEILDDAGHILEMPEELLGGLTQQQHGREELVHEFRVRCDVDIPEDPFPEFEEHRGNVTGGHRECLENCERQVIHMAGEIGVMRECLGVAYRDRHTLEGRRDGGNWDWEGEGEGVGEGECRYWSGGENEFLPVDSLTPAKDKGITVAQGRGRGGRWQVIYM